MAHKGVLIALIFLISSCVSASFVWSDCGIPLTRQIEYQSVTLFPETIDYSTYGGKISVNIGAKLQNNITKGGVHGVNITVNIKKDGVTYLHLPVGDLCTIIESVNQQPCNLAVPSSSYHYSLPPLPTGNYSTRIIAFDQTNTEIGCLEVNATVNGLATQTAIPACGYNSSMSVQLSGSFHYNSTTIQVGPLGLGGTMSDYPWGTFVKNTLQATPDVVGNQLPDLTNYGWGIAGSLSSDGAYEGTFVLAYLPNPSQPNNAVLVQQAIFSFNMDTETFPPVFQNGIITFSPKYYWPSGFPYPLALGNLNPFVVVPSSDGTNFDVSASRCWCTYNCAAPTASSNGQVVGTDTNTGGDHIGGGPTPHHSSTTNWKLGAIIVGSVGGAILIAIVVLAYFLYKNPRRPTYVDDTDPMDPQKPDYGSIAINEIFEDDEQDYL